MAGLPKRRGACGNFSLLVTLNNALDYRTNGLYRTPNPKPNPSPLAR